LEKWEASFLFSPSHSPDYNPIEEFFGTIEAMYLKKYGYKRLIYTEVIDKIMQIIEQVTV